jgi:hypothetical protein
LKGKELTFELNQLVVTPLDPSPLEPRYAKLPNTVTHGWRWYGVNSDKLLSPFSAGWNFATEQSLNGVRADTAHFDSSHGHIN